MRQHLNAAVEQTRRAENKRLQAEADKSLQDRRALWLRDPAPFDESQPTQLAERSARELSTGAARRLKEAFRGFFACQTEEQARAFFQLWQQRVKELGNAALQKVATMFERHGSGLTVYIERRVTNALAEGLNRQIQLRKAKACSFRDASGFRRTILFHLEQIALYPHELQ